MIQLIKENKLIITGSSREVSDQLKLLAHTYKNLGELLRYYQNLLKDGNGT